MSARTSNVLGILFIAIGLALLVGHYAYHKEWHTLNTSFALGSVLLGALILDPTAVQSALKTLGTSLAAFLPWKNGTKPPDGPGV